MQTVWIAKRQSVYVLGLQLEQIYSSFPSVVHYTDSRELDRGISTATTLKSWMLFLDRCNKPIGGLQARAC